MNMHQTTIDGDAPMLACPICKRTKVPISSVDALVRGGGKQLVCGGCGAVVKVEDGVVVVNPAPADWGYTKWNKIQKVADEAWAGSWEAAAKGQAWLGWSGRAMPLLACGAPEGGRVLDIGSGPGAMLVGLASAGFDVTGLDASQPLLRFCAARAVQQGVADKVRLVCSDFNGFEATKASYDMVVMNGFLEWLPEFEANDPRKPVEIQAEAVSRAAEWLKPGGVFVIGLENRFGLKYLMGGYDDHTNLRFTSIVPRWLGGWLYKRKHGKPFRCHTPSLFDLHRWAKGAGLAFETVLSPLPTYREPHACVRADDVDGALEVADINRAWIAKMPRRHRLMAALMRAGSPILRLFPGLGRFLTNYFIVVLRKPGGSAPAPWQDMDWNGNEPIRMIRNQHVGTFADTQRIVRVSLAEDRAGREAEIQEWLAKQLPEDLRTHINAPTKVIKSRAFGLGEYARLTPEPGPTVLDSRESRGIAALMRAMSELPPPDGLTMVSGLAALYALSTEGDQATPERLRTEASRWLPLDRLSHGDLTLGNLVKDGSRVVLVDWEAAGLGHPWLDWVRLRLASNEPVLAADLSRVVARARRLFASDDYTRALFPHHVPDPVQILACGYTLVLEDLGGLKQRRSSQPTALEELTRLVEAREA